MCVLYHSNILMNLFQKQSERYKSLYSRRGCTQVLTNGQHHWTCVGVALYCNLYIKKRRSFKSGKSQINIVYLFISIRSLNRKGSMFLLQLLIIISLSFSVFFNLNQFGLFTQIFLTVLRTLIIIIINFLTYDNILMFLKS